MEVEPEIKQTQEDSANLPTSPERPTYETAEERLYNSKEAKRRALFQKHDPCM